MSGTVSERKDATTGDPEGEWDSVVKRISERIKKKPAGTSSSTQSSLDLAGELVTYERRAVAAEQTLERERDAFAVRFRDMEDKLRKLEPWLRQLKSEYQKAAAERDQLREEMKRPPAGGASAADLQPLQARLAAAESERDLALADLKQMRRAAGEKRRSEEEVKRLLKEIEQLNTTTSVHKAVARASQEEVEALKKQLAELEHAAQETAEGVENEGRRAKELAAELEKMRAELDAAAAAERKARDEAAAHAKDAAESRELAEEAMRSEGEARTRADALAAQLASSGGGGSPDAAAGELLARLQAAELRVPELQRSLDAEKSESAKRLEAAESTWRSQMRAADVRVESDVQRERERTLEAQERLRVAEERAARVVAAHEAELARIRAATARFLAARTRDLVDGVQRLVAGEAVDVPPTALVFDGEVTAAADTVAMGPPAEQGSADWDRVLSDVESLRSDVEGMNPAGAAPQDETSSMTADVSVALAQSARAVEVEDARAETTIDPSSGKRRKRRK